MLSKTSFKIVNCILILLAIASIALCFSFQSYFSKNSRDCLTEEYLEVFDQIAQKGTISISVTTDSVTRPEIYKLENNKYVSIVSSYTHTDVLNIKYTYSKKQDDYKIAITSNMKDSLSNKFTIKVIYTDLNDYTSYTTSYYLDLEKNNFVKSKGYYDLEQKIEDRINLMISEFSTEMEKLVEEKLDLKISFYEDFNLASKLFLVAGKVSYVNIPLHNYNQTNVNSIMHKFSSKYMTDEINGCLDAISFYTQLSQIKPFEDVLSYRLLKAKKGMLLKSSEVSKYSSIYPDCHKYIFTCTYYNRKLKFMAWCATHGLLCIDYFVIFLRRIFKR